MRIACHRPVWAPDPAVYCRDIPGVDAIVFETPEAGLAAVDGADALVIAGAAFTAALAARIAAPEASLRWIQFLTTGTDAAERFGVPDNVAITHAGDIWAPAVAEHAVALLLACLRHIPDMERLRRRAAWNRDGLAPLLRSLDGAVVGLLGTGAIGAAIAARLRPFGARVVGFARTPRATPGLDVLAVAGLPAWLPRLDAMIAALPLTTATRGMIGAELLAGLKPGCVFVNVGRGATVDEAALCHRLRDGGLAAALDVFAEEPLPAGHALWGLENVILSPHVAGFGNPAVTRRLAALCHDNIARFHDGRELRHRARNG